VFLGIDQFIIRHDCLLITEIGDGTDIASAEYHISETFFKMRDKRLFQILPQINVRYGVPQLPYIRHSASVRLCDNDIRTMFTVTERG